METDQLPAQISQLQVQEQTLEREVILVAGGTGRLGAGIVKALLMKNAIVVVPSHSQEQLEELVRDVAQLTEEEEVEEVEEYTGSTTQLPASECALKRGHLLTLHDDIGDMHGAARIKQAILEKYGRLDRVISAMSR